MKLENQQVNFDLSRQLCETDYKQEGLWWWNNQGMGHWHIGYYCSDMSEYVSPTVAELGEELADWQVVTRKINKTEWSCYCVTNFAHTPKSQFADTEANARAKMWLYLKKEGLL